MTEGYPPLGQRFSTRSEVKLIARNTGHRYQKSKVETKPRNKTVTQKKTKSEI